MSGDPQGGQTWVARKIGGHEARIGALERWRERTEGRGVKLVIAIAGGLITIVATVIAAVILAGMGVIVP